TGCCAGTREETRGGHRGMHGRRGVEAETSGYMVQHRRGAGFNRRSGGGESDGGAAPEVWRCRIHGERRSVGEGTRATRRPVRLILGVMRNWTLVSKARRLGSRTPSLRLSLASLPCEKSDIGRVVPLSSLCVSEIAMTGILQQPNYYD